MTLITDSDYFLQSLRLAFLRLDSPLHASSTAHLVQSTPAYALSQYALQAGLSSEYQSDFGLSHSPGAIPSTSSSSSGAGHAQAGRPDRSRDRGLKYSQTIVGRHGAKAAAASSVGPSTRVSRGKRSSWRPKPHQLEALQAESLSDPQHTSSNESLSATARGRDAPNLIVDSADETPHPSPRHQQRRAASDDDEEVVRGEATSDFGPRRHPASSTRLVERDPLGPRTGHVQQQLYDHRTSPFFHDHPGHLSLETRSLSDVLGTQTQDTSPTDSTASRIGTGVSSIQAGRPASASEYGAGGETDTAHSLPTTSQGAISSSSVSTHAGADEHSLDGFSPRLQSAFNATGTAGEEDLSEDEEMDGEEEDDFEFSLPGRDATSSFENSLVSPLGMGIGASASHTQLPSIDEGVETSLVGEDGQGGAQGGEAPAGGEDDDDPATRALKAAQNARRRARRRVNISGRVPFNIGIPTSPEAEGSSPRGNAAPVRSNGLTVSPSTTASPFGFALEGPAPPGSQARPPLPSPRSQRRPLSPATSLGTASSRPLSPSSPLAGGSLASPVMSTSNGVLPRSRPSSARLRTRQRSKTEPASLSNSLSLSRMTSPIQAAPVHPAIRREKSEASSITITAPRANGRETAGGMTYSPSLGSLTRSTSSLLDDGAVPGKVAASLSAPDVAATAADDLDDGNMTEPVKPLNMRSKSATAALPPSMSGSSPSRPRSTSQTLPPPPALPPLHIPPHVSGVRAENSLEPHSPAPSSVGRTSRAPPDPYVTFPITRQAVLPKLPPAQSALSLMLRAEEAAPGADSSNPFNEHYGALFAPAPPPGPAGRFARRGAGGGGPANSQQVTIYYPWSKDKAKPLQLSLKSDLVVEEIVGCALWKYWEEKRKPSLLPDAEGNNAKDLGDKDGGARRRLGVSSWVLRIADEDEDGEVDDDFPPPDRTRPAKGFGTCYAVVEASASQAKQNQATDAQIQRRPSRIIKKIERTVSNTDTPLATLAPPPVSHIIPAGGGAPTASLYSGSFTGTPSKASFSMAGSSAPLVYLRIRIPLKAPEYIMTTLHVPSDMYLADVLELTCKKRFLENPKDWILVVPDRGIVVPLDRTVESLQGTSQLALQRKSTSSVTANSAARMKPSGLQNTNPNASIFKRLSEPPQPKYVSSADLNTNYRSYIVQRKLPMPLGRHERILSLDNDYIHIMPSETKLASGTVRTASYHVSQVAACKASKRAPSNFKLVVWRDRDKDKDRDVKRYDFEAANGRMATEIAQTVQALMQAYKESVEQEQYA